LLLASAVEWVHDGRIGPGVVGSVSKLVDEESVATNEVVVGDDTAIADVDQAQEADAGVAKGEETSGLVAEFVGGDGAVFI